MTWDDLKTQELLVYSTNWCADCRRLKQNLEAHGVPYREINIDADAAAAARLQRETGRIAIPYVQIDGKGLVRGWHEEKPGKWDDELFLAEIDAVWRA